MKRRTPIPVICCAVLAAISPHSVADGLARPSARRYPPAPRLPAASSLRATTRPQHHRDEPTTDPGGDPLEDPGAATAAGVTAHRTALSMTIEELGSALGGRGRARLAWDCYSNGVDPERVFGPGSPVDDGDGRIGAIEWHGYDDGDDLKRRVLPTSRRTQHLGEPALRLLAGLHSHCGSRVEGGLATLTGASTSEDGTAKLLLRMVDGLEVETVLIPSWPNRGHENNIGEEGAIGEEGVVPGAGRTTVCVSSQVGCRQGCTFCATGKMGRLRSLTTDEILAQLFFAKKVVRLSRSGILCADNGRRFVTLPEVSNVVFMGMGEPSDNSGAVNKAIAIMTQNDHFRLSASRVTVSTVAPSPEAFSKFLDSRCVLAWSVHAVRDDLRKQLVPTTKHTMEELRQGLVDTLKRRSLRTCMIEVALMDGVNDSLREADELAEFVSRITKEVPGSKMICNLIPFNDIGGVGGVSYRKPPLEQVLEFQKRLQASGLYAHVRGTRGDRESAACGQLATIRRKSTELEATV